MNNLGIAVKSFIINNKEELLLIKRRNNDIHKPGIWEIPGGRLKLGENPFEGLKRETREETGLDIDILNPLGVHYFTRDDKQKITMIIFYCKPLSNLVKLSEEHTEYLWNNLHESFSRLDSTFHEEIRNYKKYFSR